MRNTAVTLCLALLSSAVFAQESTFFSEVVEVRITNVDVIVTGRDGKPVTGLTRDDFELYENGVRKEISNFLELRGAPAGTLETVQPGAAGVPASEDIRRRDITIFIDNSAIHPFRRDAILPHIERFVAQNVRGGDTVSIATWASSLKIELESTTDRAAILAAAKRLAGQTTLGSAGGYAKDEFYRRIALIIRAHRDRGEVPPWSAAVNEARAYAMTSAHSLRQRVEALKSVIAWRRGVEGRKILVLLTADLVPNPAEEAFLYIDSIRNQFENNNSMAMSEAREFELPSLVEQVVGVANSAGVTLYPIDTAGKESGMGQRDASSAPRFIGTSPTMMPTLNALASETGGIAMSGSDNWQLAFDTISNDLATYYSLGYRSEGERQDRMKNIEVKLRNNKRYTVRTRRAVIERSLASEMHDAVASNLFRPAASNELSIRAAAGAAAPKDASTFVVPITITIPLDKLTLVPEGSDLTGRFALYAAFSRKDGAVSKVSQQPQSFRFPADSLKRRKDLTVKLDVTTDAETNGLSVGVMDELSRATGFASVQLR